MKKFLSTILAVVMVLGSMATVAFADGETATGTIKVNDVEYSSISAAEAAAGVGGTINISGTIYLSSREGIETDGLKLIGDGTAVITTADNFSAASYKNRKSVLNVTGEGVTIENITFDGGTYGSTLVPDNTEDTEFNVLRINEGTVTLKDVTILNSNRTLLSIGTADYEATVTANGLYCDATVKTIDNNTYADVNVVNGTLYLNSGEVNGLVCTDDGWDGLTHYVGYLETATDGCHFKLDCSYTVEYELFGKTYTRVVTDDVTSTVEHFVATYEGSKNLASTYKDDFLKTMTDSDNTDAVSDMVDWAELNASSELKVDFGNLLLDAADYAGEGSTLATTLTTYASRLGVTEAE